MTLNIGVSPLTGSAVIPDQGLTPYGRYTRVAAGGHTELANVASGNNTVDPADLSIAGRGLSVVLERYYNSLAPRFPPPRSHMSPANHVVFGLRWSSFLDTTLTRCTLSSDCLDDSSGQSTFRYRDASGATYFFPALDFFGLTRTNGLRATVINSSGTLVYDNGTTLQFSGSRLTTIQDRNGNTITIDRDSSGLPTAIHDTLGRTILITTNAGGQISSIVPPAPLAPITYTYAGGDLLQTVTRGVQKTQYNYNDTDDYRLASINDPNNYVTGFTYTPFYTERCLSGRTHPKNWLF